MSDDTSLKSLFEDYGYSKAEVDERKAQIWHDIFESGNKFYNKNDDGTGYVMDTGNNDVRTEGMSYAMMLAVQYNRQDVFDSLWQWVMKYMYMTEGPNVHYFAWSVDPSGIPNADGPAPDGEEWFAMDLFLAQSRWGSREGIFDYEEWGRAILKACLHREDIGGFPMWNLENYLIKFIPEVEWSDPSYHLPHFYEFFARHSNSEDKEFWKQAAARSRDYLILACDPETGLNPEYANYDGSPHIDERDHWHFFSDAYRTAANIGLDTLWNGPLPELSNRTSALQEFLETHDSSIVYDIHGNPTQEHVLHPVGLIATTAQASLASRFSELPESEERARRWVAKFWDTPLRTGDRRYYDNFLYAFAFLVLSGNFRRY